MNNWKEEFEKKFTDKVLGFQMLKQDDIFEFIQQVEQDAYTKGWIACRKTTGNDLKQEGIKEGLESARKIIIQTAYPCCRCDEKYHCDCQKVVDELRITMDEHVQQELNKL